MADGFEENVAFLELTLPRRGRRRPRTWPSTRSRRCCGCGPAARAHRDRRVRRRRRAAPVRLDRPLRRPVRRGPLARRSWPSRPETATDRVRRDRTRRPSSPGSPPSCRRTMDTVRLYDTYLSMFRLNGGAPDALRAARLPARSAAIEVLKRLDRARRDWREDGERSSFALSAITGSGKTVIATAVIEALLFGSTDLDTDADPRVDVPLDHRRPGAQPPDPHPDVRRVGAAGARGRSWRSTSRSWTPTSRRAGSTSSTPRSSRSRAASPSAARTRASSRSGTSCAQHDPRRARPTCTWSSTRRTGA